MIRVLEAGVLRDTAFLDIHDLITTADDEQGLLSMAFSPAYATNHLFYVDYTDVNGDTRVVEYQSDGTSALPDTARELLFVDQPYENHNGGQLQFGPDGKLYVGMGDGGSGGDPDNNGQNLSTDLAKLLSTDPATPDWQIAGYGLRNPWRFSFDRGTGDLYIGDVGQDKYEEVDYRPAGAPPANYGWSRFEGNHTYKKTPLDPTDPLVKSIVEYSHKKGCAVIGGYVYRGPSIPAALGRYFYGDLCSGTIWSFKLSKGKANNSRTEKFTVSELDSFGEDAAGNLYLVSLGGAIYKLVG